jgi:FHA domain
VVGGPDRGARFAMLGDALGLGREPDMDAVMTDPRVSRRHARIALRDDALYVEDLGSSSGTAVNGVRVEAEAVLRPGDRLAIGASELVVLWAPSRAPITEEGPLVGVPATDVPAPTVSTAVLDAGAPPARALPGDPAPRLAVAAATALLGVLVLVCLAPPFLGGDSIGGSGEGGPIAQTVLEGVALLALGALMGLSALGVVSRPAALDRLLAAGLLLVAGIVLGQGMMAATLSLADRGPAAWLLLTWGLLAVGAGAVAMVLAGRPAPLRRDEAVVAASAGAGGVLAAIGAPLGWLGGDVLDLDGFEFGAGKALLSFAIIVVLAAAAPIALWAVGRPALGALVSRAALLPLAGLLFGFGLTICTVLAPSGTLKVGAVLALVGGLLAACAAAAAVLVAELRREGS